jgi:hypothetical protein
MTTISIDANPGNAINVTIQVLDGYGSRDDGYQRPEITSVLNPSLVASSGFPAFMTRISKGLYYTSITIPSGSTAVGTYIVSIRYPQPNTAIFQDDLVLINVHLPFGVAAVFPS